MLLALLLCQEGLLGDPLDLRRRGLRWSLSATAEVFSNVRGGLEEGTETEGLLDLVLDADLETLAGWTGATARLNPLWIEGRGLTREHVGDLTRISNIDARDAVRVFEAWLEQAWGPARLRAGLLAADQDFALSEASALFINGTFGLPIGLSVNAPFSAYPLGALGLRARAASDGLYAMLGVYEGSPDSEAERRSGLEVRLDDEEGVLWIAEGGWTHENGALKAGFYVHSGVFLDFSSGDFRRGQHGVYGLAEQSVVDGLRVFVRAAASPERNALVSRYLEAGVVYREILGLAWVRAELSDEIPGARYESVVEATLRLGVTDWLAVQPDVQYVRHPGGFGDVDDAVVVGLRVDVLF